jgi:PilZ domain
MVGRGQSCSRPGRTQLSTSEGVSSACRSRVVRLRNLSAAGIKMSDDSKRRNGGPSGYQGAERRRNERRRDLRFPFVASVEAVEPKSSAKILGRTSDISAGGCYVDTISPFSAGTIFKIRLTKEAVTFEADARVAMSQVGMGMGVAFISAMPQQMRIFQKWLNELRGVSSLEQTARENTSSEQTQKDALQANSTNDSQHVLGDLLHALMKKGILSDDDGKAMLRKLNT